MQLSIYLIISYLIGSVSSAIVICKLMRLPDPRTQGSGNPGATNVARYGGKKATTLTLLSDILKGVIPVLLAHLSGIRGMSLAFIGLAAVLGHIFPIFFKFRGGKGVATGLGILCVLAWPLAIAAMLTWLIVAFLFRYSSLAAIVTAVTLPIYNVWLGEKAYFIPLVLLTLLLLIRHQNNIRRLVKGEEKKI